MKITAAEHQLIAQAIQTAEAKTSGEIFCILARRSGDYRETSLAWAVATAFLIPLALLPFGLTPDHLPLVGAWSASAWSSSGAPAPVSLLADYAVEQAVVFIAALLFFSIPAIRRLTTPKGLERHRVRGAAMEQFLSRGLHLTRERTGILIYASIAERLVEVVADEGIHAKVGEKQWEAVVNGLTQAIGAGRPAEGFITAIGQCGEVLAAHFPPGADNPNEIPDTLLEI
jgi:putative membrane protein